MASDFHARLFGTNCANGRRGRLSSKACSKPINITPLVPGLNNMFASRTSLWITPSRYMALKYRVFEAISGVPFPVRSNVCTRFPMELVLRKTAHEVVNASILPHSSRTKSEKAALAKFKEKLEAFHELPNLIDRATTALNV
ncbi:hypothetical protein EDB80DRAFT_825225 [Ilyonectria destructans]|nr:hypothetical protein EDB80DRAFT_825225 [Ilyonectria destructans]